MIGIYFREHTIHLKLDSGLKGLIINIDLCCAVMFENLYSRNITLVQIHGLSDTHTHALNPAAGPQDTSNVAEY